MNLPSLNPWRGLRGMPADVWIVFATTLVNRLGTMVLPFLVLYLTQHLGYSAAIAGFSLTVFGFGGLISAPLAGWLSDRVGGLRVMQASLFLGGALLLVLPLARALPMVFGLIFLWALVSEAVRPASLAALMAATPPEHRKAAASLNRLAINLGMSVGPAVAGFLAVASFPLLFLIDGSTSIIAGLFLTLILWKRSMPVVSDEVPAAAAASAGVLRNPRMLAFLVGMLIIGAVFFQIDAAFPLYLVRDLGLPASFFGLTFVLNTVLIIVLEVPLNLAMAAWAHRTALVLGALLMAAGFGALALTGGRAGVTGAVVLWTFGEMILFPVSAAYVAELAPAERRGAYVGAYFVVFGLAMMVGPWAGTVFMERFGATALWIAVGACAVCAAAILGTVAASAAVEEKVNELA